MFTHTHAFCFSFGRWYPIILPRQCFTNADDSGELDSLIDRAPVLGWARTSGASHDHAHGVPHTHRTPPRELRDQVWSRLKTATPRCLPSATGSAGSFRR